MLEIFVILAASRHIASMMKQKGRSPAVFVALFVVLWFGGEILGAIFGVAIMSGRQGQESFKIVAYLCALLGALVGGAVGYLISYVVPAHENQAEATERGFDAPIPAILLEADETQNDADIPTDAIQTRRSRPAGSWDERHDKRVRTPRHRREPNAGTPVAVWIVVGVAALGFMLFLGGMATFVLHRDAPRAEIPPPVVEVRAEEPPVAFDTPPPEVVQHKIEPPLPAGALATLSLPQHSGGVLALGYSDDGKLLAVATRNERVYWFDAASRKLITQSVPRPKNVHGHQLSSAAVSPDAERVAFYGHGGLLFLVDRNNLALDFVLNPVGDAGTAQWKAAFSPDGKRLCTTHGDRLARVWSLEKREFALSLGGFDQQVGSVAYSADGSLVACADDDIHIFDGKTDALRGTIKGPQPFFFHALTFAPDGMAIAGLHDRTVHYFKLRGNGQRVEAEGKAKLLHHLGRPRTVAFSPDGTLIVTGSDDGSVAVWNAKSLERRGEKRLTGSVEAIAFRSTDGQFAAGSGERVVLYEQRALMD